ADRNRSHWSTSKTPSYTKSVSWHHYLNGSKTTDERQTRFRLGVAYSF
ncbi:oligogalacturonate-specific porin KdgM family protein, partial [Lelliottia amnigena]